MDSNKNTLVAAIKDLEAAKNYDGMLAAAQNALTFYPKDKDFEKLLSEARAEYVNEKLHSTLLTQLEEKGDWASLVAVYKKLLSIFPESDRLPTLLKKVEKKILDAQDLAHQNYYKEAELQIKKLIDTKKLEDAEQACYEILSHEPSNHTFLALLAHIQHLIDKEMDKALALYFKESIPDLEADYKAHKDQYTRI